jgi:hypothetical protein
MGPRISKKKERNIGPKFAAGNVGQNAAPPWTIAVQPCPPLLLYMRSFRRSLYLIHCISEYQYIILCASQNEQ